MTITEPLTPRDLDLFHRGDPDVFRRLVDTYSPRLMAIAVCYAADRDDALDLIQETWFRVYRKRRQFSATGSLIGWLYTVCRSVCLDVRIRRRTRERLTFHGLHPSTGTADGDQAIHHAELRRSLHDALDALPAREREITIMRLIEGRSTRETAERLGCAEGTVKAALHHAVQKLKSSMESWVS